MSSDFSRLICGVPIGNSAVAKSLTHLTQTFDLIADELPPPHGKKASLSPLYTPFLVRSLLEVSFTALVARADPFRILTIAGAQSHSQYDPSSPVGLAFRWQGDVLSDGKSEAWNPKLKPEQISRALLGDYQEQVLWRPAFQLFLDHANGVQKPKEWTAQMLKYGLVGFLPSLRSLASSVFSRASKGIHHEFVIPATSYYDPSSLQDLLDDCVQAVASLAVVASFCEHLAFGIPAGDAFEIFEGLQE